MSVKKIFDQSTKDIIELIRLNFESTGASATGKTLRSLEDQNTEERLLLLGAKSFLFVEKGRKPGKKPPFAPILEWVQARGIGGQNEKGVAWAVVHAIGERGAGSLRTDKTQSPRDIFTSVVNQERINTIVSEIQGFKVAEARSEIVDAFRGQGVKIV